jgi:hypothetical protein
VFELEEESEEMKMNLMIFCFCEDLHRIQDFLHEVWRGYKASQLDLLTASIITSAAFDIVRKNEEEVLATAPKLFSKKRSFETIAVVIFYADALAQSIDPEKRLNTSQSLEPTPFDDFIYLSTVRIVMKFDFLRTMQSIPAYPMLCLPMRAGYISRPELLENFYMSKREAEDAILSQLIMDSELYDDFCKVKKEHTKFPLHTEDELFKCLRKLKKEVSTFPQ